MRRKKKKFNLTKAMKKVKRMIKLGLILAIIFLILCLLLWLWDLFQNGGLDIFPVPKRHYNDVTNSLQLLQEEVEMLKMKNSILETDIKVNQAMITYQNELINDIQETINNPAWSSEGVTYQYKVIETTENYEVLEFEEVKAESKAIEMPKGILDGKYDVPIIIGVGLTLVKGLLWSRGIPAF